MKNKINFLFNLLTSVMTYLFITHILNIKYYNGTNLLIFFLIFYFYNTCNLYYNFKLHSRTHKYGILTSIVISFSQVLGFVVYKNQYNIDISVFRQLVRIPNIINVLGLFFIIYNIYVKYIEKISKLSINETSNFSSKKIYILTFLIILFCWIPYFLVLFPGVLTPDSIDQFSSIANGINIVSDHHPVAHTLFIGIFYNLSDFIFHNSVINTAFVSITQMIIMASIFSYCIVFLNSCNVNKKILIFTVLFFSLSPLHAYYSMTMWKDVLFGGIFTLFIIELMKIDKEGFTLNNLFKFILISLVMLFFRNNAIYMYIIIVPFTIYHYKNQIKKIIFSILTVLMIFYLFKGPIFNHFNITKSSSSEYIAIPMQQIGRMAFKGVQFTEEEKALINEVINYDILKNVYNPTSFDSIKFNSEFNIEPFNNNKEKYLKLWLSLVLKHPSVALESYLNSTLGYWYVDVEYWATSSTVSDNNLNIVKSPKIHGIIEYVINKITSRNIPILSLTWSIGLGYLIIFISVIIVIFKKQYNKIYYYMPIIGIWLTMMLATPVFAEFRYIYSAFTTLPIYIIIPYLDQKEV